jgi:hypothetical protein
MVDGVKVGKTKTAYQNASKRKEMLNADATLIQNAYSFPRKVVNENEGTIKPAQYDYKINIRDSWLSGGPIASLEDRLMELRAVLGIPVHGSNSRARSMKYYMYNRFKSPDPNLAHNKSFMHVFFTRPDCNLLAKSGSGCTTVDQIINHTEAAMLWRKNPDLFKLLVDCTHCNDDNNFNFLLSNQVTTFDIQDETLSTNRAGKSWNEYEIVYGDAYSGRTAGEFTCNFNETSDYSVVNLLKLWITYIDNVSRGAWNPSYNLPNPNGSPSKYWKNSHVYTRTLDYAASVYVFKVGADGEDILYWSKYYGVFPLNTGAGALGGEMLNVSPDTPKLNIRFQYSYKRDMNPISLIEFNNIAKIIGSQQYEPAFYTGLNQTARPFVGVPYVEMRLGEPATARNRTVPNSNETSIRLKFKKDTTTTREDKDLYRSMLG